MKILHVLSQRPMRTGSGVTLDAIVREAAARGHEQAVVCGVPASDARPAVGGLPDDAIHARVFESPLPGMSDVMPYESRRFSDMSAAELADYRRGWVEHLQALPFEPDVIHSHHLWILSAMLKDLFPDVPVLTHCHATGLRQMELCPHLQTEVVDGIRRNDAFAVLHDGHAQQLAALQIEAQRIHRVGAGYRAEVFSFTPRAPSGRVVFAGKYSESKGLPQLLDAIDGEPVTLHAAGAGEADLVARMNAMPNVVVEGRLAQPDLAALLAGADVLVLPSFYEGLPLVLVEALATGCRVVSTALPGVSHSIAPFIEEGLHLVALPRMISVDQPDPKDLPDFVGRLRDGLRGAVAAGPLSTPPRLDRFTWSGVVDRVEKIWRDLAD